jgi:hypothetical protein
MENKMKKVTLITPLSDLNYEVKLPIKLSDNISLENINPLILQIIKKSFEHQFIRNPYNPASSLIIRNVSDNNKDGNDLREEIEEVILRLRLIKPGGVGFSFIVVDSVGWYDKPPSDPNAEIQYAVIASFIYTVWEREGMPSSYIIKESDIESIRTMITNTKGRKLLTNSAYRYFFRSYHEPYATDRFLSNAIGLENLLVNDSTDRSNIRYKFADRGSYLLQKVMPCPDGAEKYYKDMLAIYDGRSQLVHSKKQSEVDWHKKSDILLLQNSEAYLRKLLLFLIENPEMEKSENIDKSKRKLYK